ncbi:gpi-anchor transamidase [Moniliophthora roreri MCA 2997]|uniref:Gpi-anchor transamidase n=2 Tax=Moniliophthora roreri TaxID=221103 RepID=V2XP15_MONRO|nr:gpi-anchor transamidase [Moniliophthora roreri MCA 2997]KAI3600037.1 gpi-anchor transamidase [Moniliophthora roreri]
MAPLHHLARLPVRILQIPLRIIRPAGDINLIRVRRRRRIVSTISRRITFLRILLFLAGYLWLLAIPSPHLGRGTYIDENALQPGQVNTYWNWDDVHNADRYLETLERLRDSNATSEQRTAFFVAEFRKIGIPVSTQRYKFNTASENIEGTNTYAILSSPRASGTEAMVISASWISRMDEGSGHINYRGVSTVIALAKFLKQYSLWAKDLIFVLSDGYMDGMQAWLCAYHGSSQDNLSFENLDLSSGVIWTALNIDYPGHSFSHLGIFHEGLNGRLPNQDLLNSFNRIASYRSGVPVILYDHLHQRDHQDKKDLVPAWIPSFLRSNPDVQTYSYRAKNVYRHVKYQASGRGSGVHGLFHRFRIDAFTIFALPAMGPHGFHAIGKIIESTLRTTNNLLERLHASFFFYVMTGPDRFIKIGNYLPSAILISVGMMFSGLKAWIDAAKDNMKRPVLAVVLTMIATHVMGVVVFMVISTGWTVRSTVNATILYLTLFAGFLGVSKLPQSTPAPGVAPLSIVLKALNLCFASTVVSVVAVLNFSLAATLAAVLGIPLAFSFPSSSLVFKFTKFSVYATLGLGWTTKLTYVQRLLWDWEVLGVWLLPFLCIVYTPLMLQAGLVCLLS